MVAMYDINKNEIKTKISNLWVLRIFHWHKSCNSEIRVFGNGGEARAEFEEQKETRNDCDKPSESTDWDISLTKGLSIGADLFTYEDDCMHKKATAKKAEASSLWVIKVVHCYGDDGRFEVFDNASEARSRFKRNRSVFGSDPRK